MDATRKHTPAPWGWDAGDVGQDYSQPYCTVTANNSELVIAEVNDRFDRSIGHANANLIAAAPEMYEALKALLAETVDALTQFGTPLDDTLEDQPVIKQARAAIAKAEGRQP